MMQTEGKNVGISPDERNIAMDIPRADGTESEVILNDEELKLDNMSDHLESTDFSRLLELDEKNDDELFHGIDILEHHIKDEERKEVENKELPTSEEELISTREHEGPLKEVELESPKSLLSAEMSKKENNTPAKLSAHDENTPAAIIQERLSHSAQRHNSLTPMMFPLKQLNELKSDMHDPKPKIENSEDHPSGIELNQNELHPLQPKALPENDSSQLTDEHIPGDEQSKISAYARLDFQDFTFYVQTLQVIIGRRSENDFSHKVDVNLGPSKSISRRHAQIFYNFGTGRFELSIMGKNGAFVDDNFVERGSTVPLKNKTKIQIGQIPFQFVLPDQEGNTYKDPSLKTTEEEKPKQPLKKKEKDSKEKEKKLSKPPKPPKKVYTLQEIPPEYRVKPTCSYSNLITSCLRKFSTAKGMSLSEVYAGIRELFPYYKYCPDGWQSSVRHNLSLNKSFRKVSKEGKGWLWGLDEEYIAERERQKKKQAEAQAAKARAAELKQQQQQEQRLRKQQQQQQQASSKQPNMAQTLAANRSDKKTSAKDDNQRTMKYLQEQLMILTKDRKGLDKSVMAQILTQALAMTINQVTQAAKAKGISGNPLTALIDKNPEHLNLILAAAVNAATVKVTAGKVKQLVNMPPPTVKPQNSNSKKELLPKKSPSTKQLAPKPPTPSIVNPTASSTLNNDQTFDPTSLSKFFQPKQQGGRPVGGAKTPTPPPTLTQARSSVSSVLPAKRPASDTESSESEESGSSESDGNNNANESSEESSESSSSSESGEDDREGDGEDSNSDAESGSAGSDSASSSDESQDNDSNSSD